MMVLEPTASFQLKIPGLTIVGKKKSEGLNMSLHCCVQVRVSCCGVPGSRSPIYYQEVFTLAQSELNTGHNGDTAHCRSVRTGDAEPNHRTGSAE